MFDTGFFVRGGRQNVEGRGVHVESKQKGQNVIFDLFPCTISLSLYIFSHGVIWTAPWSPNLRTPPPPLLLSIAVATAVPSTLPSRPAPVLLWRLCCDLWPWLGAEKQRSASGTRPLCVRDDEEGHLICRSGDVLQERCTHCHYYYYYSSTLIS